MRVDSHIDTDHKAANHNLDGLAEGDIGTKDWAASQWNSVDYGVWNDNDCVLVAMENGIALSGVAGGSEAQDEACNGGYEGAAP